METRRKNPGGLSKFLPSDREECGVIVTNTDGLSYILKVPNHAENDGDYAIAQEDVDKVAEVLSEDEIIVGFFHTHLARHKCEPSEEDFRGARIHPEYVNLIYKPTTGEVCWYGPAEVET